MLSFQLYHVTLVSYKPLHTINIVCSRAEQYLIKILIFKFVLLKNLVCVPFATIFSCKATQETAHVCSLVSADQLATSALNFSKYAKINTRVYTDVYTYVYTHV